MSALKCVIKDPAFIFHSILALKIIDVTVDDIFIFRWECQHRVNVTAPSHGYTSQSQCERGHAIDNSRKALGIS